MVENDNWHKKLEEWLEPFLRQFNKKQAYWAPFYLRGLMSEERRKSVEPLAARVAPGQTQQLHHFVSTSNWTTEPLEKVLTEQADALVGGDEALLIVDDTALVKKGRHSAGVGHQYCGELGKKANCQSLVSLTLARGEVPVAIGLRLFLPEAWDEDMERRAGARVPESERHRAKWQIALEEIDRVILQGARFGAVVADAGYGNCSGFRNALSERGLRWAVGILPNVQVYRAEGEIRQAPCVRGGRGRPRKHAVATTPRLSAQAMVASLGKRAWHTLQWRRGLRGALKARFAMVRVRLADGAKVAMSRHLPGERELWLVCEERVDGDRRYYLSNLPDNAPRLDLARVIKGRWSCEQAHQQMKQELGLNHYEGRSWLGLHHHALMVMIGFCFLQWLRLQEKKDNRSTVPRRNPACRRCCEI